MHPTKHQHTSQPPTLSRLVLQSLRLLVVCVALLGGALALAAPDAPSPQGGGQVGPEARGAPPPERRIPPREAIEACAGKREGDPCRFVSQGATLEGQCLSGMENVFACRPHRGAPPPEVPAPTASPADRQERPAAPGGTAAGILPYLLVALITAGLTWYALSRYTVAPLRRLRQVTQRLAGGDLSARVGEGLVLRRDEVADLGRDVDRMADRIESLVGAHQRLIRDVSHELRSPLARLNVALELARQSAGPEHAAPFDRIERESERLNDLIGQLLTLTRLESESGMKERADLDIAALVREVAQDVDFEAQSQGRGVVVNPCGPLTVNGNRELLRQALENLIRNAARYTAEGTEVTISLRKSDSSGQSWVHLEVRDQGPGVPEAELKNIFRPFYRVNDARERQSGGAGVGLAIAERAVYLHGGTLRAGNAPGGGLIMEMALPLRCNEARLEK